MRGDKRTGELFSYVDLEKRVRSGHQTTTGLSKENIAANFLAAVLDQPRVKKLLSTDHFTVDGTLIEAWASLRSFEPRDGSDERPASGGRNTEADFHGKKR